MKRRKFLIEVSYTPMYGAETKSEIKMEERTHLNYLQDMIETDFHENGKIKLKIVKNDTSRV